MRLTLNYRHAATRGIQLEGTESTAGSLPEFYNMIGWMLSLFLRQTAPRFYLGTKTEALAEAWRESIKKG